MRGWRAVVALTTSIGLACSMGAASAVTEPVSRPGGSDGAQVLERPARGERAIRLLGDRLPEVARANEMSSRQLREMVLDDPAVWVDPTGGINYIDPAPQTEEPAQSPPAASAPYPYDQTFELHSKAGSSRVIYLDFNGHLVSGTKWNSVYGISGTTPQPAYDTDGAPSTFSDEERDVIQSVWQQVSEDFAPFDVDVTTQDPGAAALSRSSSGDTTYGIRALVTKYTNDICSSCGGVAQYGAFDEIDSQAGADQDPAWIYYDVSGAFGQGAQGIAGTVSHEVGHTLELRHDRQTNSSGIDGYYDGHGAWAPIMGQTYTRPITQWSKGEFASSYNQEDDLAVIAANGAPLRADEPGNTPASATPMGPGTSPTVEGIIGTDQDKDYFAITRSCTAAFTADALPAPDGPNLDIRLRLLDSAGEQLAADDPPSAMVDEDHASGLDAHISLPSLAAGTYYLEVDGVGALDPATTGYSGYGSLGAYELTAAGCGAPTAPTGVTTTKNLGGSSITMAWQQPSYNGGYAVTGYVLTRNGETVATLGSAERSHTFIGLQAGSQYTLGVAATNAQGTGAAAQRSLTMGSVPPSAPRNLSVSTNSDSGRATVRWDPPSSAGDSPVTSYRVELSGTDRYGDPFNPRTYGVADEREAVYWYLSLDTPYTVTITASNGDGPSPAATRTFSVVLPRPPSVPRNLVFVAGDRSATATWDEPADVGSKPIEGYELQVRNASGSVVRSYTPEALGQTTLSQVVTGLTNGQSYSYRVRAYNGDYEYSPWASSSSVTPKAVTSAPSPPGIGTAASGARGGAITAKARWTAPTSTGGSAITGYIVRAHKISSTGAVLSTKVSGLRSPSTRAYNMPLARGKYRFSVVAVNAVGRSAPSATSNLVTAR